MNKKTYLIIILSITTIFFGFLWAASNDEPDTERPHLDKTINNNEFESKIPAEINIVELFNRFDKDNLHLADKFYAENVVFEDPLGRIEGLSGLKAYYANLYDNVQEIRFEFHHVVEQGNQQVAMWTMYMRAKGLNRGREVQLIGNSHVIYKDGKAIYHRDYFDMGDFIYEYIPGLNRVIRFVKARLKK